ncbi:MAG: hypothetical protein H6588_00330 [Flavobacteriales bacterium]|nr:hypothetical protein [Flavobacteriales bacterium]
MRNYQQNINYTSSKEYYLSLKKQKQNLNSSKQKLNKTDYALEKILTFSYNVFNPLFKDESNVEYKVSTIKEKEIDTDFDKKLTEITPTWLLRIFNLLLLAYQKLIGKKINKAVELIKKIIKPLYAKIAQKINLKEKKEILGVLSLKYFAKTKPT